VRNDREAIDLYLKPQIRYWWRFGVIIPRESVPLV